MVSVPSLEVIFCTCPMYVSVVLLSLLVTVTW